MLTQCELKELLNYDRETGIFTWKVNGSKGVKAGRVAGFNVRGYRQVSIRNKNYYLHRLAWLYVFGISPTRDIDHINRVKNDNRILNLREVDESTNSENQTKPHSTNKSGAIGVTIRKTDGKYRAIIRVKGKNMHLGYFVNVEDAETAYLKAKKLYHRGYVCEHERLAA